MFAESVVLQYSVATYADLSLQTYRTLSKARALKARYPAGRIELVEVKDIERCDLTEAMAGDLAGIFHVASPYHFKVRYTLEAKLLLTGWNRRSRTLDGTCSTYARRFYVYTKWLLKADTARDQGNFECPKPCFRRWRQACRHHIFICGCQVFFSIMLKLNSYSCLIS